MGQFCLGESQSRLYPHMRVKFGRDPTFVPKKASLKFIYWIFSVGPRPTCDIRNTIPLFRIVSAVTDIPFIVLIFLPTTVYQ